MSRGVQWLIRIVLSIAISAAVAGLALHASWQQSLSNPYLNGQASETWLRLKMLDVTVQTYRQQKHRLPPSLAALAPYLGDEEIESTVRDQWGRPFVYTVRGDAYSIVSYGLDGRPGGAGRDADLSNRTKDPASLGLTFRQFLTEPLAHDMIDTCLAAGAVTLLLCLFIVRPADFKGSGPARLAAKLLATLVAASLVGAAIAAVHQPSGH